MLRLSLRRRRQLLPYLFLGPGLLWLIVFFLIPLLNQAYVSLQSGNAEHGLRVHLELLDLQRRDLELPHAVHAVARCYAGVATVLDLIIAFPLAYFIAFKAGRLKNLMLLLIILPFFTSYLVRTVVVAADPVRQRLGRGRGCATSGCVVARRAAAGHAARP